MTAQTAITGAKTSNKSSISSGRLAHAVSLAEMHCKEKNFSAAIKVFEDLSGSGARNDAVYCQIALVHIKAGQPDEALKVLGTARNLNKKNWLVYFYKGEAFRLKGEIGNAVLNYNKAFRIDPRNLSLCRNLMIATHDKDGSAATIDAASRIIIRNHGSARHAIQSVKLLTGFDQADASVRIMADFIETHKQDSQTASQLWLTLSLAHHHLHQVHEAEIALKTALLHNPSNIVAQNNLAKLQFDNGDEAQSLATLDKALAADPDSSALLYNKATILQKSGRLDEASKLYDRLVELDYQSPEFHYNLALLNKGEDYEKSLIHFDKAAATSEPFSGIYSDTLAQQFYQMRSHFDWRKEALFTEVSSKLGVTGAPVAPFSLLTMQDDPETQLARARTFSNHYFGHLSDQPVPVRPVQDGIINIAYLSADFHDFPGMHLMSGMFDLHDRRRFKIFALSYGPDRQDFMRQKIMKSVDKFIDVADFSDQEIVALCSNLNIHVAIHRNGYTALHRTGIFALRAAPVQVNYLGYPCTMGAGFMDYIVADPTVIPPEFREFYSEKLICLPDVYQPNDYKRKVAEDPGTRADHGLPETGRVLCCFNSHYKISPAEMDIWIRVMQRHTDTVLWLIRPKSEIALEKLTGYFEAHGIARDRLCLAPRVPNDVHLARHVHADIFVDTFNYNAHTTASDALLMGVPVVTKIGKQFSARVAASLLRCTGFEELVTADEDSYFEKICALLEHEEQLQDLKKRLAGTVRDSRLYDTAQYTRHFEAGIEAAVERLSQRLKPNDVFVRPIG